MADQLLVPRELLDDLRASLAGEIDDRASKFGEDYRPHILLGLREKLAAVDTLLAQPASEPNPAQWQYLSRDPVHPRWMNIDESDSVQAEHEGFEVRKLFTYPAPAGVVLPEPMQWYNDSSAERRIEVEAHNACREETARLNGVRQ